MKRGVFVTGTDTNIGKTVLSAALIHRYRPVAPLRYWKPVQTGAPEDDDTTVVRRLAQCADAEICDAGYRLPRPLSPHLSAELSGAHIDIETITGWTAEAGDSRSWIVEGAGGVLVPLNETQMMIGLIAALGVPALVMARSQLGTINHTLLTLEALRARSIPVAGVVLGGELNRENRRAIETYGCVQVLGEMPRFPKLSETVLRDWARAELDKDTRLAQFLTGESE
jgi:dethiobiotin synthase